MTRKKVIGGWMLTAHHEVRKAKRDSKNLKELIESLDGQGGHFSQIDKDQLLNVLHTLQSNLELADESIDFARQDLEKYGTKKGGA